MENLVWLIPALPLAGFVLLLCFGTRLGEPAAGWLGTLAVFSSFVVAVISFVWLHDQPGNTVSETLFTWIPAGDFEVGAGYLFDPLSSTMILFITGIGTLIHLYSIGYMHGDPRFAKFFLYLNLFLFSMIVLVLGDNLLLTFLGWEGVGTCSYFLISFWFEKPENASAGKKAFVTNRIGDWGFMVGMFAVFFTFGTITYTQFLPVAAGAAASTATFIMVMLFIGAIGKSAQIPLFVWLPDAMAGPTPVSALIHAATMVTAGVYLMCRMNPMLAASWDWMPQVIAWTGALTALVAATIAMAQVDIKKALAYSTISQLGYMFLAVGIGAYWVAIFHMITHAFFKACLFLGSGSVIHGMHEEQDMRRMGGLKKYMPYTCWTFVISWLAIAGVPPLSGFFSKDEILTYAFQENKALYAVGMVTALMTAYYMSRVTFRTFFGKEHWQTYANAGEHNASVEAAAVDEQTDAQLEAAAQAEASVLVASGGPGYAIDVDASAYPEPPHNEHIGPDFKPHESVWTMTVPLVILAFFAATAGLLNLPFPKSAHFLENWLAPVFEANSVHLHLSTANIVILLVVSTIVALGGIAIAWAGWLKHSFDPRVIEPKLFAWAWFYDWGIAKFMGGPGREGFSATAKFDAVAIDGAVNGVGRLSRYSGIILHHLQNGYVRLYALMITIGAVALIAYMFSRITGLSS